jgi:hypothetical protein
MARCAPPPRSDSMIRVHSAKNLAELSLVRDHLDAHGIATEIRNQFVGAAMGEIPWTQTWPELWVVNDADASRAEQLIGQAIGPGAATQPAWKCGACGEEVEGGFARCWNCEADRPG